VLESSNKGLPADPQAARCIPAAMSDSAFADRLEAIARDIEIFVSNRRRMTLRIAKLVSDAHDLFLYRRNEGGFTGWMKTRFDCSPSSAYRLLDVHKRFGNGESFPNWETLSDSALYLLAPPSVPQEALDEVNARVEAGEKLSCAAVTEVIAQAKGKAPATNTPGAEDDFTPAPEPEWDRAATAPGDQALLGFTASVLELKRRISRQQPSRFAKTSVAGSDLVELAEFLGALAQFKGCEPAQTPKRKSDKPFKHTLNLEANSARNGRGHHSRQ